MSFSLFNFDSCIEKYLHVICGLEGCIDRWCLYFVFICLVYLELLALFLLAVLYLL